MILRIRMLAAVCLIVSGNWGLAFSQGDAGKYQADKFYFEGITAKQAYEAENEKEEPNKDIVYDYLNVVFSNFFKADSLINDLSDSFKENMRLVILNNYTGLKDAGIYYYNENRFSDALGMFDSYLRVPYLNTFDDGYFTDSLNSESYLAVKSYAGYSAGQAGDLSMAGLYLNELRGTGYSENEILQYLAYIYEQTGDDEKVVEILNEGLKKFPKEQYFIYQLINRNIVNERYDEAVSFLKIMIADEPKNAMLYTTLGSLYEYMKDLANAEKCFKQALSVDAKNTGALFGMGRIYYNRALEIREEASEISNQKEYQKKMKIGDGLFKKALPYFEKAHKTDPDDISCMTALSAIYTVLEKEDKAEEMRKKIEERY